TFTAKLIKKDGKSITKLGIKDKSGAHAIKRELTGAKYTITNITTATKKRGPFPPFRTSTLQQEAARRYGFSAKKTMFLAQQLYEGIKINGSSSGLITY